LFGVVVQQAVGFGHNFGRSLSSLAVAERPRQRQRFVIPPLKRTCAVIPSFPISVTSSSRSRTSRLRSRFGVFGFCHSRGKSRAKAAILARCCSLIVARSFLRCSSYCSWAAFSARSLLFQSASRESATSRFAGST